MGEGWLGDFRVGRREQSPFAIDFPHPPSIQHLAEHRDMVPSLEAQLVCRTRSKVMKRYHDLMVPLPITVVHVTSGLALANRRSRRSGGRVDRTLALPVLLRLARRRRHGTSRPTPSILPLILPTILPIHIPQRRKRLLILLPSPSHRAYRVRSPPRHALPSTGLVRLILHTPNSRRTIRSLARGGRRRSRCRFASSLRGAFGR